MDKMILRVLLMAFVGLSCITAKAAIEINGITYWVNYDDHTAEVTDKTGDKYSGDIVIPPAISYLGEEFTVNKIGWGAFEKCDGLTSLKLPDTIVELGAYCVSYCPNIKTVTIPGSVESIMPIAFTGSGLESVTFEASDKGLNFTDDGSTVKIGEFHCDNLKEIVTSRCFDTGHREFLSMGKYWIWTHGFDYVTDIKIPAGAQVKDFIERNTLRSQIENLTIGKDAGEFPTSLIDYKSLKKLTLGDEIPRTCPEFTEEQFRSVELNVPESALEAYLAADGRKNFLNVTVSGLRDVMSPAGKTVTARYDLSGRPVAEDYYGVVIIRYSDGSVEKTIRR